MAEFKGLHRLPERRWIVMDDAGHEYVIDAHFGFNNGAEGLVFRSYNKDDDRTYVVAAFSQSGWKQMRELK